MPRLFIEELQLGNTCVIFDQSNCPVSDAPHTGAMHAFLNTFRLTMLNTLLLGKCCFITSLVFF